MKFQEKVKDDNREQISGLQGPGQEMRPRGKFWCDRRILYLDGNDTNRTIHICTLKKGRFSHM